MIIGAAGQDGYYLSDLLRTAGVDVTGISRTGGFLHVNIADWVETSALIDTKRPDFIFHLAADSTTRHEVWAQNHQTISTGSIHLLEAVRQFSPATKVFLSGSGLQFRNEGKPIRETDPFEATSMYAVSRIHTAYLARYYRSLGVRVYMGYFFNHDSPRRTQRHISRMVAEAVKRIAGGSAEKIAIGDWSVRKEWGFAGDIVKAIWTLVRQDEIFEAVLGTGEAHSIWDWLELCFGKFSLSAADHVEKKEGFQSEYGILVSDPKTIFSLGWRPEVSLGALADMMIRAHG